MEAVWATVVEHSQLHSYGPQQSNTAARDERVRHESSLLSVDACKVILTELYRHFRPVNLARVDNIVSRYVGYEQVLVDALASYSM
jgi:hypothetical protein